MKHSTRDQELKTLVKKLVKGEDSSQIFGKNGLFAELKSRLVNEILEAEMEYHLGYDKHSKIDKSTDNRRNGSYPKTVIDDVGNSIDIDVPRDRNGEFEPKIIPKGNRKFQGFDESVISLYARGLSMRDIQSHLEEIYSTTVSAELISKITDKVLDDVEAWQLRPLDDTYPIIYLDCIFVKTKDDHIICNKAVYLALGVNMDGKKEVLGIWMSKSEGAKFWMQVVNELKTRGIQNIYVACVDGLQGFPEAINAIFPKTIVQSCIVHMIRNSVKYVSYKDLKAVTADLKTIYTALNEESAIANLEVFAQQWDSKYSAISALWRRKWLLICPLFAFPEHIRKAVYTTNAIESTNRQIRKVIKTKGLFPDDKSVKKIVFLALTKAQKKWTMPIRDWPLALNQFHIICDSQNSQSIGN